MREFRHLYNTVGQTLLNAFIMGPGPAYSCPCVATVRCDQLKGRNQLLFTAMYYMGVNALMILGAIIFGQPQLSATFESIVAKFNMLLATGGEYFTMYVFD